MTECILNKYDAEGTRQAWWIRRGQLQWTHRGIPLRLAKNIRVGEAPIFRLFTNGSYYYYYYYYYI